MNVVRGFLCTFCDSFAIDWANFDPFVTLLFVRFHYIINIRCFPSLRQFPQAFLESLVTFVQLSWIVRQFFWLFRNIILLLSGPNNNVVIVGLFLSTIYSLWLLKLYFHKFCFIFFIYLSIYNKMGTSNIHALHY